MKFVWPRRTSGLPPGQRLLLTMPRFGDRPHQPPPVEPVDQRITITHRGNTLATFNYEELRSVGFEERTTDFHCVTTWSVRGVGWTGVPLQRLFESIGVSNPLAAFVFGRALDRRRAHFVADDVFRGDVFLAVAQDGRRLDSSNGGPFRLVAPEHYGYKSVKHLADLEFSSTLPRSLGKEHLRGRVAFEERHPRFPSWTVKPLYRLLIPATSALAELTARPSKGTS